MNRGYHCSRICIKGVQLNSASLENAFFSALLTPFLS